MLEGGTVRCWGNNSSGELGDGSSNPSETPVDVPDLMDVVQVAAGYRHSCALLSDGSVRCWGDNGAGQLGDGTMLDSSVPVEVSTLANAVQISAASDRTCALLADATVSCWGDMNSVTSSSVPLPIAGLSNVREVHASARGVTVEIGTSLHTAAPTFGRRHGESIILFSLGDVVLVRGT